LPQISQNCKLFHFLNVEENNLANLKKIIDLFTQQIVKKLSKIWIRDPGSEIQDPGSGKNLLRIPDPEVKKAPDPGSGSATLGSGMIFALKGIDPEDDILAPLSHG
jgi:hypothetical protein